MRFGILLPSDGNPRLGVLARRAEDAGFDMVAIGDSPLVFRELWVSLASIAHSTSRIRIAALVSNLSTRHPAVTAAAAASMHELSDGRFVLGLGTGDSAVRAIGSDPTSLADMERGIAAVRAAARGDESHIRGRVVRIEWASNDVPVFMSAEGPSSITLAGRCADGVLIGSGIDEPSVRFAHARLSAGIADRPPELRSPEVWFYVRAAIGDDRGALLGAIKTGLAANARRAFRDPAHHTSLPPEMRSRIAELHARYEYEGHMQLDPAGNARLVDDLDLTEFLAGRFSILGSPDACRAQLERLAQNGVDQVMISGNVPDPAKLVSLWGEQIIARL